VAADEQTDALLAREASRKLKLGRTPSRQEAAALKRVLKAGEDKQRWEYYGSVPQRHLREMTGRQPKQHADQQRLYGVPLEGKTVDLGAIIRRYYDLIAQHGDKLLTPEDPLWSGADPKLKDKMLLAQIQERRAKAALADLELQRVQGRTIDLDALQAFFAEAVPLLRGAGERMKRAGHVDSHEMLNEALDALVTLIDRGFPDGSSDTP